MQVLADLPKLLHMPDPNALADAVKGIPGYTIPADISQPLLQALMRDYSVLVSAFLLEGLTKSGKPRGRVPANIAVPFAEVAKRLGEEMIMSYDVSRRSRTRTLHHDEDDDDFLHATC